MERLSTCQLREKQVVNVYDGTVLGYPSDFELDIREGRITALVLHISSGFLGFFSREELVIPWCMVECIGEDAILVRLNDDGYRRQREEKKKIRDEKL